MIKSQQFSRMFIVTAVAMTGIFFLIALPLILNAPATAAQPQASSPLITATATITNTTIFSISNAAFLPVALQPMPTNTPEPAATPSSTTTPTTCLPDPPLPPSDAAVEEELTNRINQERANQRLPSYRLDDQLVQAARRHAYDMAANNLTGHTGSDGTSYADRIKQACYEAAWTSEIIGYGFLSVDTVMAWWLASDTHLNTILSTELEEIGVAYVWDPDSVHKHYWVVTFAKPAATSDLQALQYVCTATLTEANQGISVQWVQDRPCNQD